LTYAKLQLKVLRSDTTTAIRAYT